MQEGREYLKKSVSSWLPSLQKEEESLASTELDMEEEDQNKVCAQVFVSQRQRRDKDRMHHDLSFDLFLMAWNGIVLRVKSF